jgi:predicted RNA-binding protein with PUA-like domain
MTRRRGASAPTSPAAGIWLMKTEPDVFSIDDLRRLGVSPWDGVRNYQARNFLRAMAVGDTALIYHSNAKPPGLVGVGRIVRAAYPDHTAWDPASAAHDPTDSPSVQRWSMVDVAYERHLPRFLALAELRADGALADLLLFSRGRLSVQPVAPAHWDRLQQLSDNR